MQYLRENGLDCRGCDLSPYQPVTPALGAVIRYGVDAVDLPAAEREAVATLLLLDVLEHLREPAAFLRRAVAAFPRLRRVLITLPARPELWSNYDAFYGHHRRYDRAAAAALATDAGLVPLRCRYFYHALYLAMALQRLLGIERQVAFQPVRGDALHRLVAAGLYLDDLCLPGALPGTSVMVVARAGT